MSNLNVTHCCFKIFAILSISSKSNYSSSFSLGFLNTFTASSSFSSAWLPNTGAVSLAPSSFSSINSSLVVAAYCWRWAATSTDAKGF